MRDPHLKKKKKARLVYLKWEDLQSVHSFKLRGAYNKIAHPSSEKKIGESLQQVLATMLKELRSLHRSLALMPKTIPSIKIEAVWSYGARIELYGDSYSETYEYCMIGGEAMETEYQIFYQIEFIGRTNALGDFLSTLENRWKICLFHSPTEREERNQHDGSSPERVQGKQGKIPRPLGRKRRQRLLSPWLALGY
ncbi:MAG: threonine dehydratase [Sphaerochaeta sp.]|jgi:hypothetical protein|uniref:pyridoxal-phosphate dependent enzyme n=1 Tax=Sphaerochaeta halotolerans TaxID=2293840 RepID=UPI001402D0D1|nr:pyridoxal-phosphate dependent enzyme [Sphaerochaeta halotolerans]MBG0767264.1 pyridoxal-phosphate dependent enzyme [Spirochaetaceae bacterium]MDK2859624.1 threonine dehydratase [Sphaerochaeta sp.]MDN5334837.1 threonine dehydratase [Sphaerochaeta sp.]